MAERHDEPLPPYSYVPGGPWSHPMHAPGGHWAVDPPGKPAAIVEERWAESKAYLRGAELFNAGYYWEAHEIWEGLWHAQGRRGAVAQLLRALIKLAAAGVKVREGQPHGIVTHAGRAERLIDELITAKGPRFLGLDLISLAASARALTEHPPTDPAPVGSPVSVVFAFQIKPRVFS
jgi:uncharacterized protein